MATSGTAESIVVVGEADAMLLRTLALRLRKVERRIDAWMAS